MIKRMPTIAGTTPARHVLRGFIFLAHTQVDLTRTTSCIRWRLA